MALLAIVVGAVVWPVLNKGGLQPTRQAVFPGPAPESYFVALLYKVRLSEDVFIGGTAKNEYRGIAVKDGHALIDKRIHLSWIGRYNFSTLNCVWSKKEIAFAQIWKRRSDIKIRWHSILEKSSVEPDFHFSSGRITGILPFCLQGKICHKQIGAVYLWKWVFAMRRIIRIEGDRWGNGFDKYEGARSGVEFIARKLDLFADKSGLQPGNEDERYCEKCNDSSGNRCNCSIVRANPSKPALQHRELDRSDYVLFWIFVLVPIWAGVPAALMCYDIYRITKTIDKP
ncbi:MAG: hypothetical protein WB760_01035 [Xanthobacteraceae bacterium]